MGAEIIGPSEGGPLLKRLLRPLIPELLLKERYRVSRLGAAGKVYLRLRILDAFGIRTRRKVPRTARRFVFVCHGNIMRSPMAALLLRRAAVAHGLTDVTVNSAGLHASPGREAHPRAQVAARELGIPLDFHRSQSLTPLMVAEADAIFGMDFENLAELLTQFPEARSKMFLLSAYGEGKQRYRQIPDPYFGDQEEARRCYAILKTCIDNLAHSMAQRPAHSEAGAGSIR